MSKVPTEIDFRVASDPSAKILDRLSAVEVLAAAQRSEVIPIAAPWLRHEKALVRETALEALVFYLKLGGYVDDALRLLEEDPEATVRMQAASSLLLFAQKKKKRVSEIAAAFARSALHDRSDAVASEVYKGVDALVIHPTESVALDDYKRKDFDVALLKKLAGEA